MNKALVIVHADEPFFKTLSSNGRKTENNVQVLQSAICQAVEMYLDSGNMVCYMPPKGFTVPVYLSDYFNDIHLAEGQPRKWDYAAQDMEAKQILLENNVTEAELAGVFYDCCVRDMHMLLTSPGNYFKKINHQLSAEHIYGSKKGDIFSKIIPSKISGTLTDFAIERINLSDSEFMHEAMKQGVSVTLDDKYLMKSAVDMIH